MPNRERGVRPVDGQLSRTETHDDIEHAGADQKAAGNNGEGAKSVQSDFYGGVGAAPGHRKKTPKNDEMHRNLLHEGW